MEIENPDEVCFWTVLAGYLEKELDF